MQGCTEGKTPWAFYAHAGFPLSYSRPKEHSLAAFFGAITRGLVEAVPSLFIITAYQALSWDASTNAAKVQNIVAMLLSFLTCLKQADVCFMLGAPKSYFYAHKSVSSIFSRYKTNFFRLGDYCRGTPAVRSEEQVAMLEQPESEEAINLEKRKENELNKEDVNPMWRRYVSLVVGVLILLGTFIALLKFVGIFVCKSHFFNIFGWKCTKVVPPHKKGCEQVAAPTTPGVL